MFFLFNYLFVIYILFNLIYADPIKYLLKLQFQRNNLIMLNLIFLLSNDL